MAHKKTSDQISYNMSRVKNKNTTIESKIKLGKQTFHNLKICWQLEPEEYFFKLAALFETDADR